MKTRSKTAASVLLWLKYLPPLKNNSPWWSRVRAAIADYAKHNFPSEYRAAVEEGQLNNWQSYEFSAFLYELQKRLNGRYEFGKPWPRLSFQQIGELDQRWPLLRNKPHRPVRLMPLSANTSLDGYHGPIQEWKFDKWKPNLRPDVEPLIATWTEPHVFAFDLRHNDAALIEPVRKFLAEARRRSGISNPPRNVGRRSRGDWWRFIDLLDKPHGSNDATRSQGAKAHMLGNAIADCETCARHGLSRSYFWAIASSDIPKHGRAKDLHFLDLTKPFASELKIVHSRRPRPSN